MFSKVKPVDVKSYPSSVNAAFRYEHSQTPKSAEIKNETKCGGGSKQKVVMIILGVFIACGVLGLIGLAIGLGLTIAYLPAPSYNHSCLIASCKSGTNLYCNATFYCDCRNQTEWYPVTEKCDKPAFEAACTADTDCPTYKGQTCVFSTCKCSQSAMYYWSSKFSKCRQCQTTPQSSQHCFVYPSATLATNNAYVCSNNYMSNVYSDRVVISTDAEFQLVKTLLTTHSVPDFWLGAYFNQTLTNNVFMWVDDTVLSADSKWWASGYPKNPLAYGCVTITANGLMNQDCTAYMSYHLCEQP